MARTKISEFSATPGNNTDIDGINIAEGCAPSGINDAIRELMSQLKDFQAGTAGDSFNGPVGTTTAAAGAFTTLSASSTVSGTGFSNYLASPPAIGGTAAAAGSFTTLSASSTVTISGGTANGVLYLNASKVATSGSALTFDGTLLSNAGSSSGAVLEVLRLSNNGVGDGTQAQVTFRAANTNYAQITGGFSGAPALINNVAAAGYHALQIGAAEQMRLTSTGLGIGTSSPGSYGKLAVLSGSTANTAYFDTTAASAYSAGSFFSGSTLTLRSGANATGNATAIRFTSSVNGALEGLFGYVQNSSTYGDFVWQGYNGSYSERMRLDSSGNLGLGVTPSGWDTSVFRTFQLGTGAGSASLSGRTDGANNLALGVNFYYGSGAYKYIATGTATYYNQQNGVHSWYTAPSGTAGTAISFTQALTLHASGGLSLGNTSDPGATNLSVTGTAKAGIVHLGGNYTAGATTPSVTGISYMPISNSSATTITNFTGAVTGQIIYLYFADANTTINRANARLAGSTNFTSTQYATLALLYNGTEWIEICRSTTNG